LLEGLATNQKAAGSSPAERALKSPANRGVLLLKQVRFSCPCSSFDRNLTATGCLSLSLCVCSREINT
jgi:hypothetical protein